jgi:23S rRNA pseudouridine1911/1915/1917 synthase
MIDVLYEDNHLLVVNKPAGLPTMGVSEDRPSLLTEMKEYVGRKYHKPGSVYLGIVSRLDAPVTGVLLLARTSKAASRLTEQFRKRDVEKVYWAIVDGKLAPRAGTLRHYMRKDERHRRMHVAAASSFGAQLAELQYRSANESRLHVSHTGQLSLVEIELLTGRKHQIRVQFSAAGFPILGDRKYGSRRAFPSGIALHSRRLVFDHPVQHTRMEFAAPLPASWREFVESPW